MFARVSRYQVPLDRIADDVRGAAETERRISDMPGSDGLYYLVDRASGQTMAITLWETEQAMHDSENAASQIRQETSSAAAAQLTAVERYEVVAQPAKPRAGVR